MDSAKLRRLIGIAKRKLVRNIANVQVVFEDYGLHQDSLHLDKLDDKEVQDSRAEVSDRRSVILSAYNKLDNLHNTYVAMMSKNPAEETTFNKYLSKYGDYREVMVQAVAVLEGLDQTLNAVDKAFDSRHIPILSSDDSNVDFQHREQSREFITTRHEPTPAEGTTSTTIVKGHAIPPIPATVSSNAINDPGVINYNMSNFVDASILSKLEVPSFGGNLSEYPEFWARLSTLVHNIPQLDNSTKFSLLKSCLHGDALQSIQGLAITAANYPVAVDILRTRYDDPVTTRHILYTQLASLPACHDVKNLQSFYAQMYALFRQYFTYHNYDTEFALGAIFWTSYRGASEAVSTTELRTRKTSLHRSCHPY
ncbi:hypothetical protein Y032_0364g3548 [Ancylostoma ceylanicum]|uniref:Uncharacterized protein n=1 Tax=Ancylostoma ceylanicum TaxID=53326 RepID=A0A016RV74_9BILA|nr:hypothetical protein Y032_0364g3548 [Ancylostoma ceylanicum]